MQWRRSISFYGPFSFPLDCGQTAVQLLTSCMAYFKFFPNFLFLFIYRLVNSSRNCVTTIFICLELHPLISGHKKHDLIFIYLKKKILQSLKEKKDFVFNSWHFLFFSPSSSRNPNDPSHTPWFLFTNWNGDYFSFTPLSTNKTHSPFYFFFECITILSVDTLDHVTTNL